MKIYFENGATFITAANEAGQVEIRCNFDYTDCGQEESLDNFIVRHGGETATAQYLKERYSHATRIGYPYFA